MPVNLSISIATRTGDYCFPDECDTEAPEIGKTFSGSASSMATSDYCHAVNNCKVRVTQSVGSGGGAVFTGVVTNENCDSGEPQVAEEDLEEGESCTAVGDGEYCASPNSGDGQCGYMNDTYICLNRVTPNECKPLGDGGTVCGASAGTPPAPDDGTRGQPAAPDGTVQSQQGSTATTHNYYNSTTVSNSSVSTSDSATTGADPSDTGGSPSGNAGGGDGEGEGGDWGEGTMDEVEGFGQLTQDFLDRVGASPLLSAVGGLGESVPAGVCPEITETVAYLNTDLTIDAWCTLWPQIASIISAVMLALYAWLGIRILLSA